MIKFLKRGLFDVRISVVHSSNINGQDTLVLQKFGNRICGCDDLNANGHNQTSVLTCFLGVFAGEEYAVVYNGNRLAFAGSTLLIHMLASF